MAVGTAHRAAPTENTTARAQRTAVAPLPPSEPQPDACVASSIELRMQAADDRLRTITGYINAQHAALVDVACELLELKELGGWVPDGLHTVELYLGWKAGIAPSTAAKVVSIARRTEEFPTVMAAFARGELTLDQVATALNRRVPAGADRSVCALAANLTVTQLRRTVNRYNFGEDAPDAHAPAGAESAHTPAEPESAHTPAEAESAHTPAEPESAHTPAEPESDGGDPDDHRATDADASTGGSSADVPGCGCAQRQHDAFEEGELRFGFDDLRRFSLMLFGGDVDTGRLIELALTEARDRLFHEANQPTGDADTDVDDAELGSLGDAEIAAVSWIDALRNVCERSLAFDSRDTSRSSRYRVHAHVDVDAQGSDVLGWRLPDAITRYLTCEGSITAVFERDGLPISVGRSLRIVPDRTRVAVLRRDGGCQVPGCNATHGLEIHHIVHWSFGGPTDTWNLLTLCARHHRMHHRGMLGIEGDADVPDGVVFTNRHGRRIPRSGARPIPPAGPPPPPTGTYRHPLGERLDSSAVWINVEPTRAT